MGSYQADSTVLWQFPFWDDRTPRAVGHEQRAWPTLAAAESMATSATTGGMAHSAHPSI